LLQGIRRVNRVAVLSQD